MSDNYWQTGRPKVWVQESNSKSKHKRKLGRSLSKSTLKPRQCRNQYRKRSFTISDKIAFVGCNLCNIQKNKTITLRRYHPQDWNLLFHCWSIQQIVCLRRYEHQNARKHFKDSRTICLIISWSSGVSWYSEVLRFTLTWKYKGLSVVIVFLRIFVGTTSNFIDSIRSWIS